MKTLVDNKRFGQVLFLIIFIAHVVITYYGVIRYNYPVAPGDDTLAHLELTENLRQNPVFWPTKVYPPGVHYLILGLSSLFGANISHILAIIWPLFVIGSGLAVFFFSKKAFGLQIGLLAYLFFALVCPQPLQTAYDGGWPNVIATGIFLPITLIAWARLWQRFSWTDLLWLIAGSTLIVYTHHLSTIMSFAVLFVSGVMLSFAKIIHDRDKKSFLVLAGLAISASLIYWVFINTEVFGSARALLDYGLSTNDSAIWSVKTYLTSLSGVVFQLSLIGLILAIWQIAFKDKFSSRSSYLIVLASWFLAYLVVSRLPVAEPGRAARDLSLPATILAAFALKKGFDRLSGDRLMQRSLILLVAAILLIPFYTKTAGQLKYNSMVRFSKADVEALEYIRSSSGPHPYLVWARNGFWAQEAKDEITKGKVRLVTPDELSEIANGRSCALAGYYKPGIWQEFLQDKSVIDRFLNNPDISVTFLVEDTTKIWYRLCKK